MLLNAPAQGSTTILCDTRTALWRTMLFLRSTIPYSSLAECHLHFQHQRRKSDSSGSVILHSHLALSGLGTQCSVVFCMCNAVLGRNIITVGVKRLRCAEVLFQPGYQSNMKWEVYIRQELCAMSFCQVARPCFK